MSLFSALPGVLSLFGDASQYRQGSNLVNSGQNWINQAVNNSGSAYQNALALLQQRQAQGAYDASAALKLAGDQAAQNQKGASNQTNQNPDEDTPDQTTNPITPTNPVTPTNQVPQPPAPTQPTDPQTQQAADQLQTAINTMPGIPAHVKAELSDPEMLATIVAGFLGGGFQSLSHAALSAYQGAQQRADRQNQANQDTYDNQMEQWRARNDNSDYNEPAIQQPDPNQPNPTAGNSPETMAANRRNAAIAQGVTDVHGRTWLNPNAIAKLGQDTKYFSNPDAANWAQSLVEQQVANRMMNDPATAAAGFGRLRREIQRQKSIVLLHRDYLLSQNDGQVPTPNSPLYPQW